MFLKSYRVFTNRTVFFTNRTVFFTNRTVFFYDYVLQKCNGRLTPKRRPFCGHPDTPRHPGVYLRKTDAFLGGLPLHILTKGITFSKNATGDSFPKGVRFAGILFFYKSYRVFLQIVLCFLQNIPCFFYKSYRVFS